MERRRGGMQRQRETMRVQGMQGCGLSQTIQSADVPATSPKGSLITKCEHLTLKIHLNHFLPLTDHIVGVVLQLVFSAENV